MIDNMRLEALVNLSMRLEALVNLSMRLEALVNLSMRLEALDEMNKVMRCIPGQWDTTLSVAIGESGFARNRAAEKKFHSTQTPLGFRLSAASDRTCTGAIIGLQAPESTSSITLLESVFTEVELRPGSHNRPAHKSLDWSNYSVWVHFCSLSGFMVISDVAREQKQAGASEASSSGTMAAFYSNATDTFG
ncbi:uncharacterized [Tachysurus ichikawai]